MPNGRGKLHELLAVETGASEAANRLTKEGIKTFKEKKVIFQGLSKEHHIFDEDNQLAKQATEYQEVQTTVSDKLSFVTDEVAKYWDIITQKEAGNQKSKADIIVEGNTIAKDVPVMALLTLEKKTSSMLALYNELPTRDATVSWTEDSNAVKDGIFKTSNVEEREHSITEKNWEQVSPATKEHPAQLKEISRTKKIGKYSIYKYSGEISSKEKADKIKRLTNLHDAVVTARQRANGEEVDQTIKIGSALFAYVNDGVTEEQH